MIVLIDNYDSFTYNLYQLAGEIEPDIRVIRNDEMSVEEIIRLAPSHIILSPGPGRPADAGMMEELIKKQHGEIPILGICLGHQAICEAYGAEIGYAATLMHGKSSMIQIANGSPIFRGMPPIVKAARYHSLAVKRSSIPEQLFIIAEDNSGEVMGIKHRDYDIYGLQFHPESILTENGEQIIHNFLSIGRKMI